MTGNSRNLLDVLRDRILQQGDPTRQAATSADAGRSIGTRSGAPLQLRWQKADGTIQHWFEWGADTFDDPNAIFY